MTLKLNEFIMLISPDRLKKYFTHDQKIELNDEKISHFKSDDNNIYKENIYNILGAVSQNIKDRIITDFNDVNILTQNKLGTDALKAVICHQSSTEELLIAFEAASQHNNLVDFTLDLAITQPQIIAHGHREYHKNNFRNSNKYNRYIIAQDNGFKFQNSTDKKKALEKSIKDIIKQNQKNKLSKVQIEWVPCPQKDKTIQQAIIYRDGAPQSFQTMEGTDNKIHYRIIRPATTMCLMYNEEKGTVDILGDGGKKQHEKIAQAFKREVTDCKDNHFALVMQKDINFTPFKNPIHFEIKPQDNIQSVQVELIKLSGAKCDKLRKGIRGTFEISTTHNDPPNVIYSLLKLEHESTYNNRQDWNITKITLRIHFKKERDQNQYPKQSISFDLMATNTHNLKNLTNQHEYISEELLERWGIFKK